MPVLMSLSYNRYVCVSEPFTLTCLHRLPTLNSSKVDYCLT
jgi:hypothetical protein